MSANLLEQKLFQYRRKYYTNRLIRGSIFFFSALLLCALIAAGIEFNFRLNSLGRGLLFYTSIVLFLSTFWLFVLQHLLSLFNIRNGLSDKEVAMQIGRSFPNISDRLLNTLQLQSIKSEDSTLIIASLEKRMAEFKPIPFSSAIDLNVNRKYLKFLVPPAFIFALIVIFIPSYFRDGSVRIINYQQHFEVPAPFQFVLASEQLSAFKNEDFVLNLNIEGEVIPDIAYININERSVRLQTNAAGVFSYEFKNIQDNVQFKFSAAGFESKKYELIVHSRPELLNFEIGLTFPKYLNKPPQRVLNTGNLVVPEGTTINWQMRATNTDDVVVILENPASEISLQAADNQTYTASMVALKNTNYEVKMLNEFSMNQEKLIYGIEVIEDLYPEITVEYYADTILYEYIIITGRSSDDYGLKALTVHQKLNNEESKTQLAVSPNQTQQSFYYRVELDSMIQALASGLSLYVSASDNDGINGSKSTSSEIFQFRLPQKNAIDEAIANKSDKTEKEISESIKKNEDINDKLEELEQRLRSKKEIEWQEEKLIQDILNQRQDMEQAIKELQQDFEELNKAQNKFNERSDPLQEKAEQLQKLMDELFDEETKKLYEELQKLLQDKSNIDEIRQQLDKISPNEDDMAKELERALELFKRLKLESELENTGNELKELGEKQEKLAKQTDDSDIPTEEIDSQQSEIENRFEELSEKLQEIKDLNQELKNPEPLENTNNEESEIKESLEDIKKDLQENDRESGSQNQQKSGQEMKELGEKLSQMQMSMQMEMIQENIDDLRNILDDLIKLSYSQEELIEAFKIVKQVDPRFVELSQEQLKLKDDSKILEDSLLALASRVTAISSFVTRELSDMNRSVDGAIDELRERNRGRALTNQQYAMTSMNNLALLLDDVLQQMQNANASGEGNPQDGKQGMPDMKQLQEQLSQRIEDLKKSGKQGRALSEELAKMAAQQEMIRNQLQEMQEQLNGQPGNEDAQDNLGKAIKEMEKNEIDLVNKRLTQQLINRQKLIMTRMLAAEDAMREQDLDEQRKAETAGDYDKRLPKAFEDYLKAKEKEIELLKTVPLDLHPFYKKEVNEYFRRLSIDS